ncbi:MAG: sugar phosphate isomerase/epimerase family protein [Dehalococcoidia bacterium]|jgi:sugar phosphate isomerase/epimerase|nr:sugar phosphate isomerase/epimerase family protein [Dehalococcoidia bacterium]HJN59350.1 sugar phosphate isomerase/epimerase family protein [Dehalococcoidia bacterium]
MIKLSLQSLSYKNSFNESSIDLDGIIQKASKMRMDGVDIHYNHFKTTDPKYLEKIRLDCLKLGLKICYIGLSNNFLLPPSEIPSQINMIKKWVDIAYEMKIPMVRVFGGWLGENQTDEQAWPHLVEVTKKAVDYASTKRIILGLHNHNHGCIPATGEQVVRLLKDIDSPYFSHILDTGQYRGSPGASMGTRGKIDSDYNFYESIEKSAPLATHIRAKIYRIGSGKEAWLDYDRIMKIFSRIQYNGWLSVVYEGQDEENEETAIPKSVDFLREMINKYKL